MWRCHLFLSRFLAKSRLPQLKVSYVCGLRIRIRIKLYKPLCTDLLFTLRLRKIPENLSRETVDEGCEISHRLKTGPLPPDEAGKIAQYIVKGERKKQTKKEGNDRVRENRVQKNTQVYNNMSKKALKTNETNATTCNSRSKSVHFHNFTGE